MTLPWAVIRVIVWDQWTPFQRLLLWGAVLYLGFVALQLVAEAFYALRRRWRRIAVRRELAAGGRHASANAARIDRQVAREVDRIAARRPDTGAVRAPRRRAVAAVTASVSRDAAGDDVGAGLGAARAAVGPGGAPGTLPRRHLGRESGYGLSTTLVLPTLHSQSLRVEGVTGSRLMDREPR